jgi:hypothetical protein
VQKPGRTKSPQSGRVRPELSPRVLLSPLGFRVVVTAGRLVLTLLMVYPSLVNSSSQAFEKRAELLRTPLHTAHSEAEGI